MNQQTLPFKERRISLPNAGILPNKGSLDFAVIGELIENNGDYVRRIDLEKKFSGCNIRASIGRLRNDYDWPIQWNKKRHRFKSAYGLNVPTVLWPEKVM